MGKIKMGGFLFHKWKGDHDPEHVHVFRDRKRLVKWDLENSQVMEGKITSRILKIIETLKRQGKI